MSLQFIIGASGTGKSHYAYQAVIQEAERCPDKLFYILVPEQFTMQTQRTVVENSPGKGIFNIDVLSFQRLAYRVLEETGGDARTLLSDTGKSMVIRALARKHEKDLPYLGSLIKRPGVLDEVKSLISEFMQYDIKEEELDRMLQNAGKGSLLQKKLRDMTLLYRAFLEYLSGHYTTSEETLDLLSKGIPLSQKLKNSVVLLDGYTGFTPVQMRVIQELLKTADRVMVTVTMDASEKLPAKGQSYRLFSMSHKMIRLLTSLTEERERDIRLFHQEDSRFSESPDLRFLEENLFRYKRNQYDKKPESLVIRCAENPLKEVEDTARGIHRLVRERGLRYGEIAVITGNLEDYASLTREVFHQRGIPCFIDETHSVMMNPLIEFIRAALDMLTQQFSYESVFRYLRSGLSDLTQEEADLLENYVLALGLRGFSAWNTTWVHTARGTDPAALLRLNSLRERFIAEISIFREEMSGKGKTIEDFCRSMVLFLERCHIPDKLAERQEACRLAKDLALEKEYTHVYPIVMDLLDQMVRILGSEVVPRQDFSQILDTGFSKAKIALIPPGQDQVLVGDMERTRLQNIRALFFMGVNEGCIPKGVSGGGILTETDREAIHDCGIELAPDPREQMNIQRFYLYLNLTRSKEFLQLSYSLTTGSGEAKSPAGLVSTLQEMFPKLTVQAGAEEELQSRLETPASSLRVLLQLLTQKAWKEPDPVFSELYSWYLSEPAWESKARTLAETSLTRKGRERITREAALALYSEVDRNGATRLEAFASCAFAHFLRYGLRLKERADHVFRPSDLGTILHAALERFSVEMDRRSRSWDGLSDEERDALAEKCLKDVVDFYGNGIIKSSARTAYMLKRADRILKRTLWAICRQLSGSGFTPKGFEVAWEGGRIDRVDVMKEDGKVYVKVIDYKTGSTTFDLTKLYYGLQLQLMIYLDAAIRSEQKNDPSADVHPAGLFYFSVKDPVIAGDPEADPAESEDAFLKEYRMSGLVNADPDLVRRMDPSGKATSAAFNKDGKLRKSDYVATEAQLKAAISHVHRLTDDFVRRILEGDTDILPWRLGNKTPCEYCPYRTSCGFDRKVPGYEYHRLSKMDADTFWQKIAEESEVK